MSLITNGEELESVSIGLSGTIHTVMIGMGVGDRLDNFKYDTEINSDRLFLTKWGIPLIGATLVVFIGVSTIKFISGRKYSRIIYSSLKQSHPEMYYSLSQFLGRPYHFYAILGEKQAKFEFGEIESTVAAEMQELKHLLHPFRLSLLQILSKETKCSSIELRERLKLKPNEYFNSIKLLEKLELIAIFDDINEEGLFRQFVKITENGIAEYDRLIEIIKKFIKLGNNDAEDDLTYPSTG